MKNQRWPGDDETISQEFRSSRREEDVGLAMVNLSYGNDFLTMGTSRPLDRYEIDELQPNPCMQLDTIGMQPHSREYLERISTCERSERKFEMIAGQMIDYSPGIHFDGMP